MRSTGPGTFTGLGADAVGSGLREGSVVGMSGATRIRYFRLPRPASVPRSLSIFTGTMSFRAGCHSERAKPGAHVVGA